MTLARVGSGAGPDVERLASIQSIAAGREIYAAGGVRNAADLRALKERGVSGALIATALHERRIVRRRFAGDMKPAPRRQLDLLAVGTELLEVGDHIGDVVVGFEARKDHLGAGNLCLRVFEIFLESRLVPSDA